MSDDVIMPKLGLTMTEGLIAEWLVEDGARVQEGQAILVVETDKTSIEVEAEADGILRRIVPAGDTVAVETVLATIEEPSAAGDDAPGS